MIPFKQKIDRLTTVIQDVFLSDSIPWVIGYSGGKDSTAVLQLAWNAISTLPEEDRNQKSVHIISTDTLVESPVVSAWVSASLMKMKAISRQNKLNFYVNQLIPEVKDRFWVNLLGKGYPAPRITFRWCTSRMKINPSHRYIQDVIGKHGETIILLGTRKGESVRRARTMAHYEKGRVKEYLSPNGELPNSQIFSPIEDWTDDEVWEYLLQVENPWGHTNKSLLTLYRGATADGECPLVIDTNTPSCGNSRFGCWVCTLVDEDKSMAATIKNDREKEWLTPLLEFRNELANWDKDRERRNFRRKNGKLLLHKDRLVHGSYKKEIREYFLERLLTIQMELHKDGPDEFRDLRIISDEELREIRRIWRNEEHWFDDKLPELYEQCLEKPYPYYSDLPFLSFAKKEWEILQKVCQENFPEEELLFEMQHSLIDIHQKNMNLLARKESLLKTTKQIIRNCSYANEIDAEKWATTRKNSTDIFILDEVGF